MDDVATRINGQLMGAGYETSVGGDENREITANMGSTQVVVVVMDGPNGSDVEYFVTE